MVLKDIFKFLNGSPNCQGFKQPASKVRSLPPSTLDKTPESKILLVNTMIWIKEEYIE